MKHNGGHEHSARRPEEILAEIEQTRHEMDSTLTAIEHRLTPGQLLDQGLDYVRSSGANEFVQNLGTQVKHNPLPIALVGIGLGWLMASSRRPPEYASYGEASGSGIGERAGHMKDKMSEGANAMRDRMGQVGERIGQVGERMSNAGQSARERLSQAGQTMTGMAQSARERMSNAKGTIDSMMHEQPLALGAIGVAIGAVLAAMAPRTRREDELMGETRDRLMEQAKETGKQKLEQAKEVANAAVGTATKEAEQRGLKPQAGKTDSGKSDSGKSPTASMPPMATPAGKPSVMPKSDPGTPGGPRSLP